MKAEEVKAALNRRHGQDTASGMWVGIEEAFSGFQSAGGGIDYFAIGVWRSAKAPGLPGAGGKKTANAIVSYEVKVSRADFRKELYGVKPKKGTWQYRHYGGREKGAWPSKAYWALQRSHYFMFAVPKGLLKDEEIETRQRPLRTCNQCGGTAEYPNVIGHLTETCEGDWEDPKGRPLWLPENVGLIEVDEHGRCHVREPAVRLDDPPPLKHGEIAELIRHAVKPNKLRNTLADLTRARDSNVHLRKRLDEVEEELEALQEGVRRLPEKGKPVDLVRCGCNAGKRWETQTGGGMGWSICGVCDGEGWTEKQIPDPEIHEGSQATLL